MKFICLFLVCVFSISSFGVEMPTERFVLCKQKRATGVHLRSLKIHKITEGGTTKYVTIYTQQGQDKVVATGRWIIFCEKILKQIQTNLEKYLWICEEQKPMKVFYSDKKI